MFYGSKSVNIAKKSQLMDIRS